MDSNEVLGLFRDEMSDLQAPYLWSDTLLFAYMNDAQEMFCRLTEGIEDSSTADVCRVNVAPAADWYPLSRKILKIRQATRSDTGAEVRLINAEKAPQQGVRFDGRPGPLKAFVTGLEKHKLRAWPLPSEAVTVELSVFRLPLDRITGGNQEFEIDDQHHMALLMWMKHRAYGKEDAETYDRRKSDEWEARFRAYCEQAKKEQIRARHIPSTVAYGGI